MSIRLALGLVLALASQQHTSDELLQQIRALIDAHFAPPAPPGPPVVHVPCGEAIQPAYDAIVAGGTITLDPSADCTSGYPETLTLGPKDGASAMNRVTITTQGWTDKGDEWAGLVTPADLPRMAVIRGTGSSGAVITVANGPGAGYVKLFGIAVRACPPTGNCDLVMVGTDTETDVANMASFVSLRQLLVLGDPVFGSRRGVRIEGRHITLTQSWCQDIFIAGQDTQCVASNRGGRFVDVGFNYLAAASENIMLGGAPIPNADLVPQDWNIHDVILHKPLRWFTEWNGGVSPSIRRQVKNLFELKHAKRVTAERILMVNNWPESQSGIAILLNYSTNGTCPACGGLEDVTLRDVVVLNSPGGISFQGYSYQAGSNNANKLLRATVENSYFVLTGTGSGRTVQVTNVSGRHDIEVRRSTFRNHTSTWLMGDFGWAWTFDGTAYARVPGGPVYGLRFVDNVFASNGPYGITAPAGSHYGSGFGEFALGDRQIEGNVFGGAPSSHIANYNWHAVADLANTSVPRADLLAALPIDTCGTWTANAGADCSRLAAVFALRQYLPEP